MLRSILVRAASVIVLGTALGACANMTVTNDLGAADGGNDAVAPPSDATDAISAIDATDTVTTPTDAGLHNYDVYDPFYDPAQQSPATAITAPSEQWTWVPFGDAICANGSATGIAVNLTARSNRVLIFIEGGGACWDATTCYVVSTAVHVSDGYDANTFAGELPGVRSAPFFDRTNAANPFRDASYVFVPYCTGDVFGGTNLRYYNANGMLMPTFFMGYRNIGVFLRRLVPTFAHADRVWLSGSSAGGFGAAVNWERTQTAFGSTRVDLIDDSGPPLESPNRYPQWVSAWRIQFPAACTECNTRMSALLDYYATASALSGHRMALLSYRQDATIGGFFGLTGAQVQAGLTDLATHFDGRSGAGYFYLDGTEHTLLPTFPAIVGPGGVTLTSWLQQMVSDAPAWQSVHP